MTDTRTLLPDEVREAHTMRRRLNTLTRIGANLRVPTAVIQTLFERHDPAVETVIDHLRQGRSRAQIAKLYHVHARMISDLLINQPIEIWQLAERNAARLKYEGPEKSIDRPRHEKEPHLANWHIGARQRAAYGQAMDSELAIVRRYRPDLLDVINVGAGR